MEHNNSQQSFYQFSDELRVHTSTFANLSLNESIWSANSYPTKNTSDRRNFDIRVGGNLEPKYKGNVVNSNNPTSNNTPLPPSNPDFNSFNDGWKLGSGINLNGGFNKGIYSKNSGAINQNDQFLRSFNVNVNNNNYNNNNINVGLKRPHKNVSLEGDEVIIGQHLIGRKGGKKNKEVKKENNSGNNSKENGSNISDNNNGESKSGVDKRFKTLPPSEALPRNETVGGYIFVCNNDTMEENLKRQLFGLPPRYRDSVRQITPGLPLFLYNYSTHQLHGIYEAASFGGTNIDPTAWEDRKNPGESRFPAQVKVQSRKLCEPLEEDAFRPILHHYDGPKFRLALSVPEALSLLDIFAEKCA